MSNVNGVMASGIYGTLARAGSSGARLMTLNHQQETHTPPQLGAAPPPTSQSYHYLFPLGGAGQRGLTHGFKSTSALHYC